MNTTPMSFSDEEEFKMVKKFKIFSRAAILVGASTLIFAASSFFAASSPYAANVCNPPCPKGKVCKMKMDGTGTVCGDEIVLPDCGKDPLCGVRPEDKRKGPKSINVSKA